MKILIFAQFGPNLRLSCRKFNEDSKNNNMSTLRSILFELWPKNFLTWILGRDSAVPVLAITEVTTIR